MYSQKKKSSSKVITYVANVTNMTKLNYTFALFVFYALLFGSYLPTFRDSP